MDIKEFVEHFAAQFDETDVNVFAAETEFKQLAEWSSMVALSIIAMIDEEYDVTVKGDDIRTAKTIADLFNIVNDRKS